MSSVPRAASGPRARAIITRPSHRDVAALHRDRACSPAYDTGTVFGLKYGSKSGNVIQVTAPPIAAHPSPSWCMWMRNATKVLFNDSLAWMSEHGALHGLSRGRLQLRPDMGAGSKHGGIFAREHRVPDDLGVANLQPSPTHEELADLLMIADTAVTIKHTGSSDLEGDGWWIRTQLPPLNKRRYLHAGSKSCLHMARWFANHGIQLGLNRLNRAILKAQNVFGPPLPAESRRR
ncbi:hypothetical protein C8F04DRAFT_1179686 [Mycena alexandri]|uniref:Uncharacterized protein n=1 Tax=Mycena alexandri TaxID=1745969 RepID=A0AAD6X822_9AGAR|nr:hypothetical protein C8F04DRAFT_1179686 [Mycena alexandri]